MPLDLDRIRAESREVRPGQRLGRGLLWALAAVLYALGWTAGAMTVAVAWSAVAVRAGWRDARGTTPPPPGLERQRGAA